MPDTLLTLPDVTLSVISISIVSSSSVSDQKLLDILARSPVTADEPYLYIVDCRSKAAAMANRAVGAGYESHANYPHSHLQFYNIPNIHNVRDSYKTLVNHIYSYMGTNRHDLANTDTNSAMTETKVYTPDQVPDFDPADGSVAIGAKRYDGLYGMASDIYQATTTYLKNIEESVWLANLRLILRAGWDTAYQISCNGVNVLIHCSHGWDRTAQVSMLAQLFLDPYFRTLEGFMVLIEKDWLAFGHAFRIR